MELLVIFLDYLRILIITIRSLMEASRNSPSLRFILGLYTSVTFICWFNSIKSLLRRTKARDHVVERDSLTLVFASIKTFQETRDLSPSALSI